MTVSRLAPTSEAAELLELVRDIAQRELLPHADEFEREERFPREIVRTVGRAGLLGLPFPEQYGGGEQPAEVYLQVIEELGSAWASVGLAVSVHALATLPVAVFGTDEQKERLLPGMVGGESLGGYCLSEAHAGSNPAAMRTTATRTETGYRISGAKAWTTHGGDADFYLVLARTAAGSKGISCFHVPADSPGLSASPPERKLGLTGSHTATMNFEDVEVPLENRIGEEGAGLAIAFTALDSGRLGVAALATGVAQAALDLSVRYAKDRVAFDSPIIEHQGLAFLLAEMAARVESARATYLTAARRRDAGLPYSTHASIAKLVATDNAMSVTTDAVQVLGGAGYVRDFPAERYFREAKAMQIFEGTNQIQKLVISRTLAKQS
ncbi:MAG: acyl-CoA dehydrogenase family protein [Protaetiibacter sp.]